MKLLFCGDIMPGGVLPYQPEYVSSSLISFVSSFDFRIATLECAIGTDIPFNPLKLKINGGNNNVCFCRDEDIFRLSALGINAVSLANNHSFDLGEVGLINTIEVLTKNKIAHFGAGLNKKEASQPFFVTDNNHTIAIIGCCIFGISPTNVIAATDYSYGVYQPSIEELVERIKDVKTRCDHLIIMPHWGEEHIYFPPYLAHVYAQMMIDAGADIIIGSHSHRISSQMKYKGKRVFFGLGNFLYPDFCMIPPRPFYYPADSEELFRMEKCVNYPLSISKPTLCVWGRDSRIGLCVNIEFLGDVNKCGKNLVRLTDSNVLYLNKDVSLFSELLYKYLLLPLGNLLTCRYVYNIVYKLLFILSKIRLRHLGSFRKRI